LEDIDLVTGKSEIDALEGTWKKRQAKNIVDKVSEIADGFHSYKQN
jgi:hypothetical protein